LTPSSGAPASVGVGGAPYGWTIVSGSFVFGQPATTIVLIATIAARDRRLVNPGVACADTALPQNGHVVSEVRT
jgi:hypothetical protein